MSSNRTTKPSRVKKYSWVVIVLVIAVLVLNVVLSRQRHPLPEEVTAATETVVQESAQVTPPAVAANAVVTATPSPRPVAAAAIATPVPVISPSASANFYNPAAKFDYYVLALSWEPAFCESHSEKAECASQTATRFDATHFILHGLWPNRNDDPNHTLGYCGVSKNQIRLDEAGDWCDLPALKLSAGVAQRLSETMPGRQSCLQNHEWYKHGTCSGLAADAYFDVANRLVQLFAQTDFNRYIAANVGRTVDRNKVLDQFAAEFGAGAETNLSLQCDKVKNVSILTEIQITLKKDLSTLAKWPALFPANPPHLSGSCPRKFKIDAVGLKE